MKNRKKHYVKKKVYHSHQPISKAIDADQELYQQYSNFRSNCCHHGLFPLTRKQALDMAREFKTVPLIVSWLEKCSQMDYSMLYFYGMRLKEA